MIQVEHRRSPTLRADIPFVLIAVACGAALLYLGRSLTFWHDEWRSIMFDGGPIDYLRPLNEHWSTFHLLLYRATFGVFGLRSYLPYLAEVIVLHLVAVAGAYAVMRNRVGPPVATLASVPLFLLGAGAENLFWGFQTGFVGSVMFGLWALFFIERPGRHAPLVASALLVASLASSGIGLFFLVVAAGRTLAEPSFRARAMAVVPPAVVYLLWFVFFGRDGVGAGGPVVADESIPRFAVRGVVHSTQRVVGLDHLPDGHIWGLLLFVALATVALRRIICGRPSALAAGCLLGVVTMYTAIAFVRASADPGYDHAVSSRFVYVAAFLLVLAIVDLLPERSSWSVRAGGRDAALPAALALVLVLATSANVDALRDKRAEFQRATDVTRAFIALAVSRGHEPWVDRDAPRGWMPSVSELVRTVERHGSPVRDELVPSVVRVPGRAAQEEALLRLIGDGFRIEDARRRRDVVSADVSAATGPNVSEAGRCARARFTDGSVVWILNLPASARARFTASSALEVRIFLEHEGGPGRQLNSELLPGVARDVVIPDVGDGRPWILAVDSPDRVGTLTLCVLLTDGVPLVHAPSVEVRRWSNQAT